MVTGLSKSYFPVIEEIFEALGLGKNFGLKQNKYGDRTAEALNFYCVLPSTSAHYPPSW